MTAPIKIRRLMGKADAVASGTGFVAEGAPFEEVSWETGVVIGRYQRTSIPFICRKISGRAENKGTDICPSVPLGRGALGTEPVTAMPSYFRWFLGDQAELIVDSVRSRESSPCGIAFGDSILSIPNRQDSASLRMTGWGRDGSAILLRAGGWYVPS